MLCKNNKTPGQIVCEFIQAFSDHNLAAASDMMAEDFKRYGDPDWVPWNKAQYMGMWAGFCHAFPDFKFDLTKNIESGNTVVVEMIESGTFTQPFPGINGKSVSPNHKSYKDWDCAWYEVNEEGLITQVRAYLTTNFARTYKLVDDADAAANVAKIFE